MGIVNFINDSEPYLSAENMNEIQKGNVYSTNEIEIGRWIGGEPLYRKVILFNTPSNITGNSVAINIPELNIDSLTKFAGIAIDQNGGVFVILGDTQAVTLSADKRQLVIWFNNDSAKSYTGHVIIEYTKTTN